MDDPCPQVVALIAAATSCFYSLAESALAHYSPPRLLDLAKKRDHSGNGTREETCQAFIALDEQFLLTCRSISIVSHVAFCLAVYLWIAPVGRAPEIGTVLEAGAVAVVALLTVVRLVPWMVGRIFSEEILLYVRGAIRATHTAFTPVWLILWFLRRVTERLAGRTIDPEGHDELEEEIMSAVEEGEMEGLLRESEVSMIERALHFPDADVADVMTPRTRMFALDRDTPIGDAVRQVFEEGHSRVPVFTENMDEVVGILYAKDLLEHWAGSEAREHLTAVEVSRKPFFVPETKKISQLLDEFRRRKTHIAIVIDEYGGTAGLITIEDILEEIVGEIEDEFDESVDVPPLKVLGENEVEVDAQVHVDDLSDHLEAEIPSDDYDTVGGLVFTALGRIPIVGDEFEQDGLVFTVLDADERRVNRVRVVRTGS
ncbi:MAG: hemolysin family protein [Planctomycetota bacterium]